MGQSAEGQLPVRKRGRPPLTFVDFDLSTSPRTLCEAASIHNALRRGTQVLESIGEFTEQFTPTEGGYLFYPSNACGGKLVTADEYEQLTERWRKVTGRRARWMIVGIEMLALFFWPDISNVFSLPDWSDWIIVAAPLVGILAWLLWASFAPHRLVRDRPTITPPKPVSEARHQARGLPNWRYIIVVLLFSGVALIVSFNSPERDLERWAWLIGSGALFSLYIWIAVQKFREKQASYL